MLHPIFHMHGWCVLLPREDMDRKSIENALDLSAKEIEKAEERSAVSAVVVYEAIRREGGQELRRSSPALFWSGLAAGLSMGFSLIT
jgi:hypothetical protein